MTPLSSFQPICAYPCEAVEYLLIRQPPSPGVHLSNARRATLSGMKIIIDLRFRQKGGSSLLPPGTEAATTLRVASSMPSHAAWLIDDGLV